MRAAKVQASLRIRAVSPEPPLLAHTSRESRGTFRQKPRSLAPLNGWACAVKICHDGMLEDTNSLDAAHIIFARMFTRMMKITKCYLGKYICSFKLGFQCHIIFVANQTCLILGKVSKMPRGRKRRSAVVVAIVLLMKKWYKHRQWWI